MFWDKFFDGIVNVVSALLIIGITILFLFFYFNYSHANNDGSKEKVSFIEFINSFISKALIDKLDKEILDKRLDKSFSKIEGSIHTISSVTVPKELGEKDIMYRSSKDYGSDSSFSVRTWFGVNNKKLLKNNYKYICFNINGVKKFFFRVKDFEKLITKNLEHSEQKKYEDRNSYDTYIMKSKADNNWYITRLGKNFDSYIEIKE